MNEMEKPPPEIEALETALTDLMTGSLQLRVQLVNARREIGRLQTALAEIMEKQQPAE